jgi:RNA polymerase sigma-70 factor (ECF subfamily)
MPLDEATLTRLLMREHDKLVAYAWSLVRDDHLVDDILQEVALVALRKRDEIQDDQHFLAWMRVTCRLTALDMLKRRGRQPASMGDEVLGLLDDAWAERDATSLTGIVEALRKCVEGLTPYSRQLVELRYHKGWKSAKIASSLKRETHAIYVALNRIHRSLAECVQKRMNEEAADA